MKNFNIFEPILSDCICYKNDFYLLALKGDITEYHHDKVWADSKQGYIVPTSASQRKSEKEKTLSADVLIYTKSTTSLDWKTLYRNGKGVYFKKNSENIYIDNNIKK